MPAPPEDMFRLAKVEGYELSSEELEQVSGGIFGWKEDRCSKCGRKLDIDMVSKVVYCISCGARQDL